MSSAYIPAINSLLLELLVLISRSHCVCVCVCILYTLSIFTLLQFLLLSGQISFIHRIKCRHACRLHIKYYIITLYLKVFIL